jgi:hypothetical protein
MSREFFTNIETMVQPPQIPFVRDRSRDQNSLGIGWIAAEMRDQSRPAPSCEADPCPPVEGARLEDALLSPALRCRL